MIVDMEDGTLLSIEVPRPTSGEVVNFPTRIITDRRLTAAECMAPITLASFDGDIEAAAKDSNIPLKRYRKQLEKAWSLGYKREDFFKSAIGESLQ
jgi:hypothetical protein